ncbi:isopeptide-forming domain-containing fimbrial protein, partial [Vagococcus bubulae]
MKKKIVTLTGIILLLLNTVSGPISVFAETSDDVTRNHSVSDAQDDADDLTAIPNTERTYAEQLDITSKDGKEDVSTRTDDVSEKQDYSSFMKLSNEQQQKIASYFNWNNWQNSPNFEVNSTNQDDGSDGTTFKREGVTNMTVSTGDTIGELRLSNTSFSLQITSIPGFTTTENQFLFANPTKYRLAGKNLDKSVENKLSFFSGNVYRWETYTNIKDNGIGASGIGPNERYGDFRYYSQLDSDFYPEATPITPKITILSNQNGFYELTSRYNATTETPITSTYNHYAFYNIYSILIPQVIKVQYRDIDTGKEIAPEKIYGKGKRLNDSVNITAPNIGEYEFANKWESLSEYADYSQISGSDSGTKSAINTKLTTNERGIVFYYRMARPTGTSITKTADYNTEDKLAQIGDTVKYKVNLSTESLNGEGVKNVTVSDVLPSGMSEPRNIAIDGTKILSSSQTSELPNYEWDKSNHTMIIHLNNFSGNQKSLLTYQSKVLTGTDGEIKTNNIVFSSTDINTGDKYSPKSSWEFKIKQLNPKISIQKNVKNLSNTTSDHYVIGDKLQYKITMTNPEKDSILSDGKIIDDLPKGLSKPSDIILTRPDGQTTKLSIEDIYNEKTQQLVIPIGNLKGGESVTLTYETSIEDGTAGKELINTAKGTGKTPENKVIEESSSQKVIPVNNPSIKVEKSLTDLTSKEATVGDTLSYTIKMSNPTADSELSNGVIRDVLPAGLSAPTHIQLTNASGETSDLSASDVYDASTRTLTIPVGSLQGGQVVKVSFESEIE